MLSDEDKAKLRALLARRRRSLGGVAVSEAVALAIVVAAGVPIAVLLGFVAAAIVLFLANLRRYRSVVASAAPYLSG